MKDLGEAYEELSKYCAKLEAELESALLNGIWEGMDVLKGAHESLIKIAADLLTRCQFPDSGDDWPKTTPRSVIGDMKIHNERLKDTAVAVRKVADSISPMILIAPHKEE